MADLLRIRIPHGWAVLDNKFYDVEPEADGKSGFIRNWNEGFVEDVLWMQECRVAHGGYRLPEPPFFSIDLSWRPDGRVNGSYYAKLQRCAEDDTITMDLFESPNRFVIRDRIEFWLADLQRAESAYRAVRGQVQ